MMKGRLNSQQYQSRREFLKNGLYTGLNASLVGSLLLSSCGKRQRSATNVILISIDTLRADHLSCYGYQRPTSPILDKFASQGLLFEDVSTTCPWTLPAHASLLTGLYPRRNGVRARTDRLRDDVLTLAEVLREHDFITSGIVNSHWLSKTNGLDHGFEEFLYVKEYADRTKPTRVEDEARNWLSKRRDKKFFLFLHYYDVHSDYHSLPHYEKQFVRPYNGIVDGSTSQLLDFRYGRIPLPNQADTEHLIDLYDAGVRQMDDGMERLFALLEEKNLLDNTLIIVTSDHGEEFMEHGGVLHGRTYFQEVLHVPLIMRGPNLPKGRRIKNITSLLDVMPTLLAMLGIPPPPGLDGIDLQPLWQKNNAGTPKRLLFGEADWNNIVDNKIVDDIKRFIRQDHYKFHFNRVTGKMELYDIVNNPDENIDVSSKHTSLVKLMRSRLRDFLRISRTGRTVDPLSPKELELLKSLGYLQ
jgi:arylsulfatase A-like enzyme